MRNTGVLQADDDGSSARACVRDALAAAYGHSEIDITLGGVADAGTVSLTEFRGTRTTALSGLVVRRGAGMGGRVLATGRPVAVADYAVAAGISHDYAGPVVHEGIRSAIAMPVLVGRDVAAVLYSATRRPDALGERTIRRLTAVTARLGSELSMRREVERRVAAAVQRTRDVAAGEIGGAGLEDVREAHARLRTLATSVDDLQIRDCLERVAGLLTRAVSGGRAAPDVRLSPREVDVLATVARGGTTDEVAHELGMASSTVKTHLRSASRKLGSHTRQEAVVAARRAGLIP